MTNWNEERSSGDGQLLQDLFAACRPFVDAALATAPAAPERVTVRVVPGSPMLAIVRCEMPDGQTREFASTGTGAVGEALAHAVGAVMVRGLDGLNEATRGKLAALGFPVRMALDCDADLRMATGRVVSDGDQPEVDLFVLMASDGEAH